jgi:capsular exopolysaccharide synthesis family protein
MRTQTPSADEFDFLAPAAAESGPNLLQIVLRRKALVALGVVVGAVLGTLYYAKAAHVYEAAAQLLVVHKRPDPLPLSGPGDPRSAAGEEQFSLHLALIRSPLIVGRAVENGQLRALKSFERADPTGMILGGLSVNRDKEAPPNGSSTLLNLAFRGPVAEDCPVVLTAVIDSYLAFLDRTYRSASDDSVKLITQARDVLHKELAQKEAAYLEFRQKGPLLMPRAAGATAPSGSIADIEAKRSALRLRRAEAEARLTTLEAMIKANRPQAELAGMVAEWSRKPDSTDGQTNRGAGSSQDQRLLQLLGEEMRLRADYGPDYPALRALRKEISLYRRYVARPAALGTAGLEEDGGKDDTVLPDPVPPYIEALKRELASLTISEKGLTELLENEQREARPLLNYELEDTKRRNEMERVKVLYEAIIKRVQEMDFTKDFGGYDGQVISPAGGAARVAPKPLIIFPAAVLVGILAGVGLAYVVELSDKSFRDPAEIQHRLGLPVVGHIPFLKTDKQAATSKEQGGVPLDPILCTHYRSKSAEAESYRGVRTALFFSSQEGRLKVLQITSPNQAEGKSTLTANLGICMAHAGRRVLIVDADLRKPRQHHLFGLLPRVGLAGVLTGQVELSAAVQESGVEGLRILPCGPLPPNPAEMLTLPRFKEVLDGLRDEYDFVLVDTPPLLEVSDPCVVVSRVDAVLLTVRVTKNNRPQAERAKEILMTLGAKVLGVVVNGVGGPGSPAWYRHAPYGYGYSKEYGGGSYLENGEPKNGEAVAP